MCPGVCPGVWITLRLPIVSPSLICSSICIGSTVIGPNLLAKSSTLTPHHDMKDFETDMQLRSNVHRFLHHLQSFSLIHLLPEYDLNEHALILYVLFASIHIQH